MNEIIMRDVKECWNNLIRNPKSREKLTNYVLYHRIDALILVLSKIEDKSFVDVCKELKIDYEILQEFSEYHE